MVAAEMERQGFRAAAHDRRPPPPAGVHTAVKIHPKLSCAGRRSYVTDARPCRRRRRKPDVGHGNGPAYVADIRQEYGPHRRGACARRGEEAAAVAAGWRAPMRSSSTGREMMFPQPPGLSLARRVLEDYFDSRSSSATSTGRRSSPPGRLTGKYPAILDDRQNTGPPRASLPRRNRASRCCAALSRKRWVPRPARVLGLLAGQRRRR